MINDSGAFELFESSGPSLVERNVLAADRDLQEVYNWFVRVPGMVKKFGSIFRQSIDEVLDGQRTGRFDITSTAKTEQTYLGTKVEIVAQAIFELDRGIKMDYTVAGREVDAKFTSGRAWQIPREAIGHICLLMSAKDSASRFSVGLVRVTEEILNPGKNQDGKRTISKIGRENIVWLVRDGNLPRNLLLNLSTSQRDAILSQTSGQRRINELLRRVHGEIIDRNTTVTVARQHDGMKRCRDARNHLAPEGIVVLGHQNDGPMVARSLGLPVPEKGCFVATRLVQVPDICHDRTVIKIHLDYYAIARAGEPITPAPSIKY